MSLPSYLLGSYGCNRYPSRRFRMAKPDMAKSLQPKSRVNEHDVYSIFFVCVVLPSSMVSFLAAIPEIFGTFIHARDSIHGCNSDER